MPSEQTAMECTCLRPRAAWCNPLQLEAGQEHAERAEAQLRAHGCPVAGRPALHVETRCMKTITSPKFKLSPQSGNFLSNLSATVAIPLQG